MFFSLIYGMFFSFFTFLFCLVAPVTKSSCQGKKKKHRSFEKKQHIQIFQIHQYQNQTTKLRTTQIQLNKGNRCELEWLVLYLPIPTFSALTFRMNNFLVSYIKNVNKKVSYLLLLNERNQCIFKDYSQSRFECFGSAHL